MVLAKGLIFLLNQFLNQVFHLDVNNGNNPLAPRALSVCLQYAVDHLGIARENRPALYRAWENTLERVWPAAIQAMISDFRHSGLEALEMTELPANWSLGDKVSEVKKQTARSGQIPGSGALETSQPIAASAAAAQSLFQLMALEDGHPPGGLSWQEPNLQLKENLGARRHEILSRLRDDEPAMENLLRDLANSDPEVASVLDRSAVDKASLVDRIFAPLETQQDLSGPLRQQLQMLRLPVFETLIETPDFLSAEDHPARDIINDLMHLCLAERVSGKKLEATVTDIINELTATATSDSGLLEDVGQRLRQLVERQDQSFIRNSERLAKNLEGKERLRRTRKTAQKRLSDLVGGRQAPDILVRLLEAGWEQLIVLAMLREGPESRQCEELFDVVTQLQTWLSPEGISGELAFEKELESGVMLQFIERELKTVGDPARTRLIMKELSGILEGDVEAATSWLEVYGEPDDTGATLPAELERSRWAARAKGLAVGDWIELRLDSGETRRMRLVWGGEESLRFVFLSPKGMSEVSYGFPEFTRKLADGEAWPVKDGEIRFLDQSLFTVVEDIYQKLNFQATHDALTGCMHRHDFEKQLQQLISRSPPPSGQDDAALLVLDIDEFSVVNASFGAEAGDALLRSIADILCNKCLPRFPEAMEKIATLNVNLSGASLSDDDFMLKLESTLRAKAELAPKLCFEVTETSAVANLHFASDFMRELKRLHCRFALDDFGTGMASYAYLQKLPVDFVKIDGAFVRDIITNRTNFAMVRSINELCHFLDLRTIAEYVEDLEMMEALREIRVDYGQGFGIAKPRRIDTLGK